MTEMGRRDFAGVGSDIRAASDWVSEFSPFEGEDLPPYMTRGGPPLTREQLDPNAKRLESTGPDVFDTGLSDRSGALVGEPDATGTDYASYLEEIQALERTPEQIKGDAMTNALIQLSGLAGAATRKETAEVIKKAGRSAQGVQEAGKKDIRENILARMEIDRAADQAELNRLNAESTRRLQGAQAGYYEREVSISKYLPDLRVAIKKGPGALTEGRKP